MRKLIKIVGFIVIFGFGKLMAGDCPMLWYNAEHSFVSSDTKIKPPLKLLWKYEGKVLFPHVSMRSRPVVTNGMVYTLDDNERIIALNAYEGTLKWTTDEDYYGCLVTDGKLLYTVKRNIFVALDLYTGKQIWTFVFPDKEKWFGMYRFSTIYKGTLYFAPKGGVYALKLGEKEARLMWHFKVKPDWNTPPAVVNDIVYFASAGDNKVYALDSKTGQVKWAKEVPNTKADFEGIIHYEGKLYMPVAPEGKVYCLNANDGSFIFETKEKGYSRFPSVANGMVYMYVHCLKAFSALDGSLKWVSDGGIGSCGQMAIANNFIWLVGPHAEQRYIRMIDPATGKVLWQSDTIKGLSKPPNVNSCNGPVIVDGILYLTTNDHNFYAFVSEDYKGVTTK